MNLEPATLQINTTKSDTFQWFLKSPIPFTQNSPVMCSSIFPTDAIYKYEPHVQCTENKQICRQRDKKSCMQAYKVKYASN
jgi:hypothetical protein